MNEQHDTFCVFPSMGYWEIDGKPVSEEEARHGLHPRAKWKPTEVAAGIGKKRAMCRCEEVEE